MKVKRIHEYKRQLLNILGILYRFKRMKEMAAIERKDKFTPRVCIFGGKAFATYTQAKRIMKLITDVGATINQDPDIGDLNESNGKNIENRQASKEDFPSASPFSGSFGEIKQEKEHSPLPKTDYTPSTADLVDFVAKSTVEKKTPVEDLKTSHKQEMSNPSRFVSTSSKIVNYDASFGGGQLGRMLCQAASQMSIKVNILDPMVNCPASSIYNHHMVGSYDNSVIVEEFANRSRIGSGFIFGFGMKKMKKGMLKRARNEEHMSRFKKFGLVTVLGVLRLWIGDGMGKCGGE
ncbi:unnamed protein product [Lactuca virosa]|uniref:Alpha-1,4 glucan phosphorylase n=1 Tax=Lactuca virosa TaxID=75947 RepID=A0AAU9NR62_9ASTR|nr:unnamed protein product [Lactuca virosa]